MPNKLSRSIGDENSSLDPRQNPLVVFFIATTLSRLGNFLSSLAIPWFVLTTSGSATDTALTVAVGTVPIVVTGILGGTFVDRIGYWRSSIYSEIASGISTLLIPLFYLTIGIEFWQLLLFVFLGALLDSPGVSARRSLFPDLVAQTGMSLERANAIYAMCWRVASLIGAPLAGILIAFMGASNLLFLTAAGFAISALLFIFFVPNVNVAKKESDSAGLSGYLAEVREGFRYMLGDKPLFWMLLSFSVGSLLAEPLYAVILQVYVEEQYGSADKLGFILAGLAIGSLIGNAAFVALSDRFNRRFIILFGFGVRALAFSVFAFVPSWWVVAAAILIGAIALEPVNPTFQTIMQERVPAGMRGRVYGVSSAIQVSTFPIGIMVYGFMLDGMGLQTTLIMFVMANLILPLTMLVNPHLKGLEKKRKCGPIAQD